YFCFLVGCCPRRRIFGRCRVGGAMKPTSDEYILTGFKYAMMAGIASAILRFGWHMIVVIGGLVLPVAEDHYDPANDKLLQEWRANHSEWEPTEIDPDEPISPEAQKMIDKWNSDS